MDIQENEKKQETPKEKLEKLKEQMSFLIKKMDIAQEIKSILLEMINLNDSEINSSEKVEKGINLTKKLNTVINQNEQIAEILTKETSLENKLTAICGITNKYGQPGIIRQIMRDAGEIKIKADPVFKRKDVERKNLTYLMESRIISYRSNVVKAKDPDKFLESIISKNEKDKEKLDETNESQKVYNEIIEGYKHIKTVFESNKDNKEVQAFLKERKELAKKKK